MLMTKIQNKGNNCEGRDLLEGLTLLTLEMEHARFQGGRADEILADEFYMHRLPQGCLVSQETWRQNMTPVKFVE